MVLESTMICVDNSDYMRNGDYMPSRMIAQQDAANIVFNAKLRSNPENNIGLMALSGSEVLVTLTADKAKVQTKLTRLEPKGEVNFLTSVKVAHLVLKHRQGTNHKMRIVVFVGSPLAADQKEAEKLAKKLKKDKVNVDIISFGEEADQNADVLTYFVDTLNGKDNQSAGSHLLTVPPGHVLASALKESPVLGEEMGAGGVGRGGGFDEYPYDYESEDPDLALALRVSMEEERQRQQAESQQPSMGSATASAVPGTATTVEDEMLRRALAMSVVGDGAINSAASERSDTAASLSGAEMDPWLRDAMALSAAGLATDGLPSRGRRADTSASSAPPLTDFASMTEEQQLMYAVQLSLLSMDTPTAMETTSVADDRLTASPINVEIQERPTGEQREVAPMLSDKNLVRQVLGGIAGVDPNSEAVQKAMAELAEPSESEKGSSGSSSSSGQSSAATRRQPAAPKPKPAADQPRDDQPMDTDDNTP